MALLRQFDVTRRGDGGLQQADAPYFTAGMLTRTRACQPYPRTLTLTLTPSLTPALTQTPALTLTLTLTLTLITAGMLGYAAGLLATFAANTISGAGQPALVYIVP